VKKTIATAMRTETLGKEPKGKIRERGRGRPNLRGMASKMAR
jgi:hypothetical protein